MTWFGWDRRSVMASLAAATTSRSWSAPASIGSDQFTWRDGTWGRLIAADSLGAIYRPGPGPAGTREGAWIRETGGIFRPEWFGAFGDGVHDDSDAMAAMARVVTAVGGGVIEFRKGTYLVGRQRRAPAGMRSYAFEPSPLLDFEDCRTPLVLRGNGAVFRCASGLRYGTFDRGTGRPTRHALPFQGFEEVATPYRWMIRVARCRARVEISDFELDGGVQNHVLGGPYDDAGWQIPATGIGLYDNEGEEVLERLHLHHHALDGLLIDGLDARLGRKTVSRIVDVRCDNNGRQGCSITGGKGYRFQRSRFVRTGRGAISSAPGAGVDLEAEGGKQVRDIAFADCLFADNQGAGAVAEVGDVADITFTDCRFVGTTSWAAWPNKPAMRFSRCTFAGAIVNACGDAMGVPTHFTDCLFTDDTKLSPTGRLYYGDNPDRPIASLPFSRNALFDRCRFILRGAAVLPWSVNVIYQDCVMTQRSTKIAYPRGTYQGRNRVDGTAALLGSRIVGTVVLNGKPLRLPLPAPASAHAS